MKKGILGAGTVALILGVSPTWAEIEEVIVTATQRNVNLNDLPYPLTAVSSEQIEKYGVNDLASIAELTPGMSFVDLGARDIGNNIIIRGINTRFCWPRYEWWNV